MFIESFNKTASTRLGKMVARRLFKSTPKKLSVNESDWEKKYEYLKAVASEKKKIPKGTRKALGLDDRLGVFKVQKSIKKLFKSIDDKKDL